VSCRVLDHRFGFARGFQHFNDHVSYDGGMVWNSMPERRGDITIRESIRWIKSNIKTEDKLLVWIHLFDPHFPYRPPTGPFEGKNGNYFGEVYFADQQIRLFAQAMKEMGRPAEKSLWIITSDHGEGLGEHGEESHGLILHGATSKIPLIITGPGIANKRSSQLVSTVDIFPTILDYIGIEAEKRDGINVLKTYRLSQRAIPMESKMGVKSFGISEVIGIRYQNWLMETSPLAHLWDVEKDIEEKVDVSKKFPNIVKYLNKLRSSFKTSTLKKTKLDPSINKELQSLGYLPGNYTKGTGDVRKFLEVGGKLQFQILAYRQRKKYAKADEAARKFLLRYPKSPGMWQVAGFISLHLKDFKEAERRFQKSVEADPTNSAPYLNLGNIYFSKKRYNEAIESYERVLTIDPEDMFALYNLGLLFSKINQLDRASKYWGIYLKLYPNHKNAQAVKYQLQRWKLHRKY
jgi:tetratricopeptide (TPR) repeat protein